MARLVVVNESFLWYASRIRWGSNLIKWGKKIRARRLHEWLLGIRVATVGIVSGGVLRIGSILVWIVHALLPDQERDNSV